MRIIKFRAWNKVEECMESWYEFLLDTNVKQTFIEPESTGRILMQYTETKDKNGKEIYEGDIIKYDEFWEGDCHYNSGIGQILWDDEETGFYLAAKDTHFIDIDLFNLTRNLDAEVIGNIYENPELLEDKE